VTAGSNSTQAVVKGTPLRPIHLPHRERGQYYRSMIWSQLPAGVLHPQKGRTRLEVRAETKAGDAVMELKHVALRYVE
jgi:hypothetical protein